jgi:predicted HicB family RNase H-like nuclease
MHENHMRQTCGMAKWITVKVEDEVHDSLAEQARKKDLSLAQLVRHLLKRQVKR